MFGDSNFDPHMKTFTNRDGISGAPSGSIFWNQKSLWFGERNTPETVF